MTVVRKYPTSSLSSGFCIGCSNAYSENGVCAQILTRGSYCEYYGFGFDIPSDAIIDSVKFGVKHCNSDSSLCCRVAIHIGGDVWWTIQCVRYGVDCASVGLDEVDISGWCAWTPDRISTIRLRTQNWLTGGGGPPGEIQPWTLYVDVVWIEVEYHILSVDPLFMGINI